MRYADYFLQQYQQYSFIIMCNMFNLLNSIRIFRIVEWIMAIIEQTFFVISLFLLMLIPLQIGFGFFSTV